MGPRRDPAAPRRGAPRPRLPALRRRALARIRRGQRAGQPGGQRPDRPRRAPGRVGERPASQLRGVRAGLVRHPQGRRRDEPDQHGLQGRLPVLDDQPRRVALAGDRGRLPRPARPGRRRAAAAGAGRRRADGRRGRGARSLAAVGAPRSADGRPRRRAAGRRPLLDGRRPHHVHVGHHRPLEGGDQAERRRLLLGAELDRGALAAARRVARRPARRDLLLVPSPVPLERPGAVRVPRAAGGRPGGLRRALLRQPLLAAGDRRRGHDLQRHRRHALLPLEPAGRTARPGPLGPHDLRRPGPARHLPRVRGALRGAPSPRATASPRRASRR